MYLVTGGAGFIGSHIVARLAGAGEKVRIFDNFSFGNMDNLHGLTGRVEVISGNLLNPPALRRAMAGVNVVFHQAALRSVPFSVENPALVNQVNIEGTLNVLVAARDAGVRRVVYASSSSVYGNTAVLPKCEDFAPDPASPYAVSKLAGEHYCRVFADLYGLETVSLRYFNVFGPRQDPKSEYSAVIPRFIDAALRAEPFVIHGDGMQSRDFTYIDNVVDANLLAAESPEASGEAFNVGQNRSVTLLDVVDLLRKFIGPELAWSHTKARAGDVKHSLADIAKAERLLGYRPRVTFEEGLERTVENVRTKHLSKQEEIGGAPNPSIRIRREAAPSTAESSMHAGARTPSKIVEF
jgi:UDP-glucose 4-epimerase